MLLMILVMSLVVVFLTLYIVGYYKDIWRLREISGGLTIIFLTIFLVFMTIPLLVLIPCKRSEYINRIEEKQVLEVKLETYLESDRDINFESLEWQKLYDDIYLFNARIKTSQYWSKNKWVNWFSNHLLDDIEPIDIRKMRRAVEDQRRRQKIKIEARRMGAI